MFNTAFKFTFQIFAVGLFVSPALTALSNGSDNLGELVFSNILFRHGDRTPLDPYPNDPYRNLSYWPVGWGELTQDGMKGHYALGKWLRNRYDGLLQKNYSKDEIRIQSTDVDRTLMSAYSNLAGLYEPDPASNWNPDIHWRPIPVHTTRESEDSILAMKRSCPRYDYDYQQLWETPEFKQLLADNKKLFSDVSLATGRGIQRPDDLQYIYNTLFIETLFGFPLPPWTKGLFPEAMLNISDFSFAIPCYNKALARLKVGPLLVDMITSMEKKMAGTLDPDRKVHMYSAHDTTVASLLQGLGVFNFIMPPYYSTVLVELRNIDNAFFVTVFFRNSTQGEPHFLAIPGCSEICPFEVFRQLLEPVLPVNWNEECAMAREENIFTSRLAIAFYVLSVFFLFLLTERLILRFYDNQSRRVCAYRTLPSEVS